MVFSTTTLFKGISCPYGEQCRLTNCIFSHDLKPRQEPHETSSAELVTPRNLESDEPATKRRRITYEKPSQKPPTKADQLRSEIAAARSASTITAKERPYSPNGDLTESGKLSQPRSLVRPISPPPTTAKTAPPQTINRGTDNSKLDNKKQSTSQQPVEVKSESVEQLNPRLIPNDPAGHAKRSLYLKHLHDSMAVLNEKVKTSTTLEHKNLLVLTEQELIKMTLDEEEKVAREQPAVYANIIKQRIAMYKKMNLDDWSKQVKTTFAREQPKSNAAKAGKPIQTELNPSEELLILPHLVADQSGLAPFGYIPTPPAEAQATEAAAAVEASKNYEICDRCAARFQVFPDRNDEGLLTSHGPCRHHPNRKVFPQKTKGDTAMGHLKEPYFPCCNAVVGSPGCTENEYHVFKASTPGRLAAVLPFITTPENADPAKDIDGKELHAVSFDCEMGYTVFGLELIRLTAVAWPSGKELLDILVRPLGTIIDLNSRFSGVWPEHFTSAIPYDQWLSKSSIQRSSNPPPPADTSPPLPIVSNPQKARALLCSFLTPQTPLIGHAIDNDLNAVRLCHPTIVDTVLLFPHPRGLPMRFGLKMLASRHLGRSIQMGGERGHDSLEDAQATGDLVRVKVGEKWKTMRAVGWRIGGGRLIERSLPVREGKEIGEEERVVRVKDMVAKALDGSSSGAAGKKRRKKFPGADGGVAGDESTEDEEVSAA